MAPHDQRARIQPRQVVAARAIGNGRHPGGARDFAHRRSLTSQKRFIHLQFVARNQQRIRRHAVAFGEDQQVAHHHIGARNAHRHTVPHHLRPGAGQVPQGFQCPFGFALLVNRECQHHQHKPKEDQAFLQVSQQQIQQAGRQQQKEHGLTHRLADHAQHATALLRWQGVGSVSAQALSGLGGAQACFRRWYRHGGAPSASMIDGFEAKTGRSHRELCVDSYK